MGFRGPKFPQIAPIRPLEHEVSLLVSSHGGDELDNMGAVQLDDSFVCSDFSLPSRFKFALSFRVVVTSVMQFFDGYVDLPTGQYILERPD